MKSTLTGILFLVLLVSSISALRTENSQESMTFDSNKRILEDKANKFIQKSQIDSQKEGVEQYKIEYNGEENNYPNHRSDNPIVKNLIATVEHHAPKQLRIKITDDKESRWEVPNHFPFPNFGTNQPTTNDESEYSVQIQAIPFGFSVTRKSTQEVIFDTRPHNLIYSDLLIDLTSSIPSDNLFGLGERSSRFKMGPDGTYTIWARDKPEVIDRGVSGGHVYGHHPVYLMREKTGNWHIVLFRSSNAMDVTMEQGKTVRFRVAGGIVDIVIILGGATPESAIDQYHEYVGKWALMPFWSLGFHQSRWGYMNLNVLKDKVNKYREIKAPIDVIWSDLDYMIDKEDFTINSAKFPFDEFNRWLRDGKIHWVPIIDAGVSRKYRNEQGYDEGIKRDVFIKNKDGNPMLGTVWPGDSHYVDWFHPEAINYWGDMIERLYTHVKFSGIWLDMNEPTNFANGEVGKEWEQSRYDNLPYTPGVQPLKTMTISMDGKHHGNIDEFNVHDLFGTLESRATYEYLKKKSPLPFILTRSSAFGAGQFAAHWTGDNGASWEFMKYGTTGVFQFGIFGMPFTGADICGFMGSTTPELCARWFQSGLLYPFARNHNHLEARDQEAFAFSESDVRETAVKAIQLRYSILKWYYAQFVAKKGKGLVFKPLFFEFPNDEILYKMDHDYTDEQLMLGNSLMAIPVYHPGVVKTKGYFPPALWFNYFTGEVVHKNFAEGAHIDIPCPLGDYVPLFIKAGSIVHKQNVEHVQWSADLDNHFTLVVAFNQTSDGKFKADGIILGLNNYSDNEIQNKCVKKNCIIDIEAFAEKEIKKDKDGKENALLRVNIAFRPQDFSNVLLEDQLISSIVMYGLPNGKEDRTFSGSYNVQVAGSTLKNGIAQLKYEPKKGLTFTEYEIPTKAGAYLDFKIDYV